MQNNLGRASRLAGHRYPVMKTTATPVLCRVVAHHTGGHANTPYTATSSPAVLPLQDVAKLTGGTIALIRQVYACTGSRRTQYMTLQAAVPFLAAINKEGLANLPVSTSPNLCMRVCPSWCQVCR